MLINFLISFFVVRALGYWFSTLERTSICLHNYELSFRLKRVTDRWFNELYNSWNLPATKHFWTTIWFSYKYPRSMKWELIKCFFAWERFLSFLPWPVYIHYIYRYILILCALCSSYVNLGIIYWEWLLLCMVKVSCA